MPLQRQLVQEIVRIQYYCRCTAIARDTMFDMAKKLLIFQERLLMLGSMPTATIAFHYTNSANLASIGENGLYSRRERSAASVTSHSNHGAVYGDGIYIGNNPHIFSRYGDTCVVCIVIRGLECNHSRISGRRSNARMQRPRSADCLAFRVPRPFGNFERKPIPMLVGISARLRAELNAMSAIHQGGANVLQMQSFTRAGILFYRHNRARYIIEVLLGQLVLNSNKGRGEWTLMESARECNNYALGLAGKSETPKDTACRRFREVMGNTMSMYGLRKELDKAEVLWSIFSKHVLFLVNVPGIALDEAHKHLMKDSAEPEKVYVLKWAPLFVLTSEGFNLSPLLHRLISLQAFQAWAQELRTGGVSTPRSAPATASKGLQPQSAAALAPLTSDLENMVAAGLMTQEQARAMLTSTTAPSRTSSPAETEAPKLPRASRASSSPGGIVGARASDARDETAIHGARTVVGASGSTHCDASTTIASSKVMPLTPDLASMVRAGLMTEEQARAMLTPNPASSLKSPPATAKVPALSPTMTTTTGVDDDGPEVSNTAATTDAIDLTGPNAGAGKTVDAIAVGTVSGTTSMRSTADGTGTSADADVAFAMDGSKTSLHTVVSNKSISSDSHDIGSDSASTCTISADAASIRDGGGVGVGTALVSDNLFDHGDNKGIIGAPTDTKASADDGIHDGILSAECAAASGSANARTMVTINGTTTVVNTVALATSLTSAAPDAKAVIVNSTTDIHTKTNDTTNIPTATSTPTNITTHLSDTPATFIGTTNACTVTSTNTPASSAAPRVSVDVGSTCDTVGIIGSVSNSNVSRTSYKEETDNPAPKRTTATATDPSNATCARMAGESSTASPRKEFFTVISERNLLSREAGVVLEAIFPRLHADFKRLRLRVTRRQAQLLSVFTRDTLRKGQLCMTIAAALGFEWDLQRNRPRHRPQWRALRALLTGFLQKCPGFSGALLVKAHGGQKGILPIGNE